MLPAVDVAPDVGVRVSPATEMLLLSGIAAAAFLRGEGVSIYDTTLSGVDVVEEMARFGVVGSASRGRFWEAMGATGVKTSMLSMVCVRIGCVQYGKVTAVGAIDKRGLRSIMMGTWMRMVDATW